MVHEPSPQWLDTAKAAAKSLKSWSRYEAREWMKSANWQRTTCRVYAILLHDPNYFDPFGIYVGRTSKRIRDRYWEHCNGEGFTEVEHYHVRLLPELYKHLNPMRPSEAIEKEKELYRVLRDAGIDWVTMGTKRRSRIRKNRNG